MGGEGSSAKLYRCRRTASTASGSSSSKVTSDFCASGEHLVSIKQEAETGRSVAVVAGTRLSDFACIKGTSYGERAVWSTQFVKIQAFAQHEAVGFDLATRKLDDQVTEAGVVEKTTCKSACANSIQ